MIKKNADADLPQAFSAVQENSISAFEGIETAGIEGLMSFDCIEGEHCNLPFEIPKPGTVLTEAERRVLEIRILNYISSAQRRLLYSNDFVSET